MIQGFAATPEPVASMPLPPAESRAELTAFPRAVTPSPEPAYSVPQPSPSPAPTPVIVASPTLEFAEPPQISAAEQEPAAIERVLVVSFDGMRPDAISAAGMTNLLQLMDSGAYTLSARTISYPTTLPSHTSMLSGMCMEKHGVSFNSRNLYRGYARGTDIFDLLHAADRESVMIVAKDKLEQIPAPGTVDIFETYAYEAPIAQAAAAIIPDGFDFMFLHFPSADLVGHKQGWMSPFQLNILRQGDAALGKVFSALDEAGLRETTLIIVTADHGGHNTTHDGSRIEDYLIPWIVSGPGVVPGELQSYVRTMDTAATVAYALGLPLPPEWDGIPVYEAFGIVSQDIHYRSGPCE